MDGAGQWRTARARPKMQIVTERRPLVGPVNNRAHGRFILIGRAVAPANLLAGHEFQSRPSAQFIIQQHLIERHFFIAINLARARAQSCSLLVKNKIRALVQVVNSKQLLHKRRLIFAAFDQGPREGLVLLT